MFFLFTAVVVTIRDLLPDQQEEDVPPQETPIITSKEKTPEPWYEAGSLVVPVSEEDIPTSDVPQSPITSERGLETWYEAGSPVQSVSEDIVDDNEVEECDSAPAIMKSDKDSSPDNDTPVTKNHLNQHKFIPVLPDKLCSEHYHMYFQEANTVQMKIRKFKMVSVSQQDCRFCHQNRSI